MSKLTLEFEAGRIKSVLVDGQKLGSILSINVNGSGDDILHDCEVQVIDPSSLPANADPNFVAGIQQTYEALHKVVGLKVVRIPIQHTDIRVTN